MHVANKKAAWYEFQIALDIPEAAVDSPLKTDTTLCAIQHTLLRNSTEVEIDGVKRVPTRAELTIDPGPRSIEGLNKSGVKFYLTH